MHNLLEEYNWVKNLNSQVLISFLKTTNDIESKYKKCFQQYNLTEVQFNALVLIAHQSEQGILLCTWPREVVLIWSWLSPLSNWLILFTVNHINHNSNMWRNYVLPLKNQKVSRLSLTEFIRSNKS